MRKLFRFHRGSLEESLATLEEVRDFADIERLVKGEYSLFVIDKLSSSYCGDDSLRLGDEWKATYYVMAEVKGRKNFAVVGMSNFSEKEM